MARQASGPRAKLEYAGIAALRAALRRLPLSSAVRVGAALGSLAAAVDRFNRPVAMRNLEIAFPEKDAAARLGILRAMYRNWGRMAAEWVHSDRLNRDNIEQFVVYEGRQYLEEAERISNGRGIFFFTGHFGNFELLSLAHSLYGNRIAFVYRPLRNPLLDSDVSAIRTRFGGRIIPRKGAARGILWALRENRQVAVPIDLDVRRGVFVDFFSLKACTTDGLARLAMMTGRPVLPIFMVRQGESACHRITILPAVEIVKSRDREEAVRENTRRFTAVFEDMVRRYPDHWNWIHRRWKTRPPGEARFY